MYSMFSDVIAAVSTPRGKGGVAVIRMSGEEAFSVGEKFIFPKSGKKLSDIAANSVFLADIKTKDGALLDEALVTLFRAPRSYTGENVVEISCHGGILLTENILSLAFSCGAVQAGPGEFTRRAFCAGKLSLTEAESVIGMIDAKTNAALSLSRRGLDGAMSDKINKIYNDITGVASNIYAIIDFPDEDLESMDRDEMAASVDKIINNLEKLESSYKTGHAVCEGIPTVICGKPNTGKSTILNLLSESDRAIVTDIAGTTRDVVSEDVVCGSVLLRLSDTAGIHDTSDTVEKLGVDRSRREIDRAELVLAVFDTSDEFDGDDKTILSIVSEAKEAGKEVLIILNKSDKAPLYGEELFAGLPSFSLSAKHDEKEKLSKRIEAIFTDGEAEISGSDIITNARQHSAVKLALESARSAKDALLTFGDDIAGCELERAAGALLELDGREVSVDIVDNIFHKFCVGK